VEGRRAETRWIKGRGKVRRGQGKVPEGKVKVGKGKVEGGSTCRRERRREGGRRWREGGGWGREGGERMMGEETEGQGKADGEEIIGRDEHVLLADSNALKTNTTSDPLHLSLILPARAAWE